MDLTRRSVSSPSVPRATCRLLLRSRNAGLGLLFCAALAAQIRIDVGLVTVPVSVVDRSGVPEKNLRAADFTLRDNGRQQRIEHLWQESELPLTIGLIVDVSGSQASFVDSHKDVVAQFLKNVLGPQDSSFIVTVAENVKVVKSVDDIDAFQTHGEAFGERCPICGGTALWNAVYAATNQRMKWLHGRKALIVLSDGMDTGSPHTLNDAIESAQDAETVVYAIKYVDPVLRREKKNRGLEKLTDQTGGFTFYDPEGHLPAVFARIEDELRNLYVLAFTPPVDARDGRFHKLDVRVSRRDLIARARAGYYAVK